MTKKKSKKGVLRDALELNQPLSLSIFIFSIIAIIGFPLTVMFYNEFFKRILLGWLIGFLIVYIIAKILMPKLTNNKVR